LTTFVVSLGAQTAMNDNAVLITGIGAATPLGNSFEAIAESLLAGRSATRQVFDRHGDRLVPCLGTVVDEIPLPPGLDPAAFAAASRLHQMALWCGSQALSDAKLAADRSPLRVGLVLGLASEWYRHWEAEWVQQGMRDYAPSFDRQPLVGFLQEQLGLTGPAASVGAACASANYALALGRRWLQQGLVDICLAGSCEVSSPITRANFNNLRAISRRLDDAERAARPFDRDRDGFVMGEGAAIFVLEPAASARRRDCRVYAEVAGFGASSDASHMIIPSEDPRAAVAAMQTALVSAGLEPAQLDYVNAHATGTLVGDKAESRALRHVLGSSAATTPVSATKSMTGHLVSAAAAIEAIACIAAIEYQAIPPTINLDNPDPDCDLCHVPHHSIKRPVNVAISNSFGFGGSNTTLVLRKAS
jgi:3-oxoacyl-[acyl-carrier-protein] synthase II